MRSKSSSFSGEQNTAGLSPSLKLVFIGDSFVGKTTLLYSYRKGEFHDNDKEPTPVLEGFTKRVVVKEKEHICLLWDTIGSSDFDTLRPLSYPKTDCFVICFAIDNRSSFDNLQTLWIPEILAHCPEVPYIFVGTKTDLKDSIPPSELITDEEIKTLMEGSEAYDFVECTSKDLASVENVTKAAVQAFLTHEEKLKAIKDANSQSFCVIC